MITPRVVDKLERTIYFPQFDGGEELRTGIARMGECNLILLLDDDAGAYRGNAEKLFRRAIWHADAAV